MAPRANPRQFDGTLSERAVLGYGLRHMAAGGTALVQSAEILFDSSKSWDDFSFRRLAGAGVGDMAGGAANYRAMRALLKSCFTGRMPIECAGGSKRADEVRVGDRLWSQDEFGTRKGVGSLFS